jgi:hypothetical protein
VLDPEQSDEIPGLSIIGLPNPDAPIYRIFPLWFLHEALGSKHLAMVSPSLWEDPYEVIGRAIAVNTPQGGQTIINQSLPPVFAQSWSAIAESDTLLRAYSRVDKDPRFGRNTCPRHEGAIVKSTPRKLAQALGSGAPKSRAGHWFIGAVEYLPAEAIHGRIGQAIVQHGNTAFEDPRNRARLLLMKRSAFSHEAEVRIIFVQSDVEPADDVLRVPVDPDGVFEEITFDRRLLRFERLQREAEVRSLGVLGGRERV